MRRSERRRRKHGAAQTERLLAQVFGRLLAEPEFVAYLKAHWSVIPRVDEVERRIEVEVHRLGTASPTPGAECGSP